MFLDDIFVCPVFVFRDMKSVMGPMILAIKAVCARNSFIAEEIMMLHMICFLSAAFTAWKSYTVRTEIR